MRLKEEKILIILAVFGLLLILFTIFIQIADSRIHDYEVEIQNKESLLMNHLAIRQDSLSSATYHAVLLLSGQDKGVNLDNARKNYDDSKAKYESFIPMTTKEAEDLNRLRETGTVWSSIKKILVVCQFILIILSVIGYFYILNGIQKRLKQKVVMKGKH